MSLRARRWRLPAALAAGLVAFVASVVGLGAAMAGDGVVVAGTSGKASGRTPVPAVEPAASGTRCVADPAFMRRNHMELLKHQRNETVHEGVREARDSLKACVACHASQRTGSVAQAPSDFCVQCHRYAAVTIDCFECHASRAAPTRLSQAGSLR